MTCVTFLLLRLRLIDQIFDRALRVTNGLTVAGGDSVDQSLDRLSHCAVPRGKNFATNCKSQEL